MPTARLKLGMKKERCVKAAVPKMARRRERRERKQALRQIASYDPAHWPEADYVHD